MSLPKPTAEFLEQKKKDYEGELSLKKIKDEKFIKSFQASILEVIKAAINVKGHDLVSKGYIDVGLVTVEFIGGHSVKIQYITDEIKEAYIYWKPAMLFTPEFIEHIKQQGYKISWHTRSWFPKDVTGAFWRWWITIEIYDPSQRMCVINK